MAPVKDRQPDSAVLPANAKSAHVPNAKITEEDFPNAEIIVIPLPVRAQVLRDAAK